MPIRSPMPITRSTKSSHADKIIFNSIGQLTRFEKQSSGIIRGLRLNPGVSSSSFDLADPARPFSRLGEWDLKKVEPVMDLISGFMIHNNCENGDFDLFDRMLGDIEQKFGPLLKKADWVSLGGGIHFTGEDYPLEKFASASSASPASSASRSIWSPAKPRSPSRPRSKSPCSTSFTTARILSWWIRPSKRISSIS